MPIKPQQPLYQQVYDEIKNLILTGSISTGSKINVTKLADQFQISRTPLREALRQLQKEGLLLQDHKGTTVVNLNREDFDELCFCRLVLEKEVIRLVVKEISSDALEEAEKLTQQAEEILNSNEGLKKLLEVNAKFHEVLIHSTSNKNLINLLDRVRSLLILYRANILKNKENMKDIIKEHKQIVEVIKERSEEKAVKLIEEHLQNDQLRGISMFDNQS